MKKRLALAILILAFLPFVGCAVGNAWYYPYGPPYLSGEAPGDGRPQTVSEFVSLPRPE